MKDFEVQARICPKCFDDHEADRACSQIDWKCPHCNGHGKLIAKNEGVTYWTYCVPCSGTGVRQDTPNPSRQGIPNGTKSEV